MIIEILTLRIGCIPLFNERFPSMRQYAIEKKALCRWRANRRYARQPIPNEFRQAAAEMTERVSPSLVRRILKLDPWRLKKPATEKSDRALHKPQAAFFTLPPEAALILKTCFNRGLWFRFNPRVETFFCDLTICPSTIL
jgi:hypothetical protein